MNPPEKRHAQERLAKPGRLRVGGGVRSQIKRVLRKSVVQSQAGLVAGLLGIGPPIRIENVKYT
jgi:hypothetical protein